MKTEDVTKVLREYLKTKKSIAALIPLASKIFLAGAVLILLEEWVRFPSGTSTVLYYLYLFTMVLTFANDEYFFLTVGIGIKGFKYVYECLYFLIRWREFTWTNVLHIAVYGLLLFLAYRKAKSCGLVPEKVGTKVDELSGRAGAAYKKTAEGLKNVTDAMTVTPGAAEAQPEAGAAEETKTAMQPEAGAAEETKTAMQPEAGAAEETKTAAQPEAGNPGKTAG